MGSLNLFRIKQFVPKEFCLNCQGCCRYNCNRSIWAPSLLWEEKGKLNLQSIELIAHRGSYICKYLNPSSNLCQIYAQRPLECRLYPFLLNRCKGKIYLSVDLNCPFIKERINSKEFKRYSDYIVGYLESPAVLAVLNKNHQAFSSYHTDNIKNLVELVV